MSGFTVGNTNIFTSNTFSATFNGLTVNNQLVFEAAPVFQGSVSGYTSGGFTTPFTNVIDKFPFSTDTNASDVGNLSQARAGVSGQSSSISGYSSGGDSGPSFQNTIDKFPFSVDTDASDVGDLTNARNGGSGQQV